jgi:predicted aldo/keto reductase-like oxidoreductase
MSFPEIKKNFGFGCMRLPMKGDEVDYEEFNRMIDAFIDAGFNYFDTARGYIGGKSELAIRDCLAARYPRESFLLANKLTHPYFETEADVRPFFEDQLKRCGVEYFDFYLFHTLNATNYKKHKACKTFETVKQLKEEGKIRHIAMSFHDTADVLDMILSEQGDIIEAVQLQFNYLDYDDPGVQSKKCYDVVIKHGKKVLVMEPVKGGTLVNLPDEAAKKLSSLTDGSQASFAIRYAASFPEVVMVLSGMGNMEMMNDNISTMRDFVPLSETEMNATEDLRETIRRVRQIQCTKCEYCVDGCPAGIKIPYVFANYNNYLAAKITRREAKANQPADSATPDACIKCGACEEICPQSLPIRELLSQIAERYSW